jgi:glycosyltransferase involved in cell wall biosynthesis
VCTASVIISSHNYARFLRQAIESALAQTHRATEVIVVDDGSTDGSRAVIAEYDGRVRAILKDNGGQGSALNAGFAASRGEVVVFLDSDDALEPDAVEQIVSRTGPSVSKVHGYLRRTNLDGRMNGAVVPVGRLVAGDLRDVVLRDGPRSDGYVWPPTSGNAFSRAFLERVMPIPVAAYRTCPDLYLCALAPLYGEVAAVERPLGLWRYHGGNNSWKESFLPGVERCATMWEHCFADLERHARRLSLTPDPLRWRRDSFWHRLLDAARAIRDAVPAGVPFVLIDGDQWFCNDLDGRPALPLVGRRGESWGPPADDAQAALELEARRDEGAAYLALAWTADWWRTSYPQFHGGLDKRFRRVAQNDNVVVYDLKH